MTGATTIDAALSARRGDWLVHAPFPIGTAEDERLADALLCEFERSPTRSKLIEVILGGARQRNLYEACRDNLVSRRHVATRLEFACRNAAGGTALAGLWKWRRVFWSCLVDGKPPPKRRLRKAVTPAAPNEVALAEVDKSEQVRAVESSQEPNAREDIDLPYSAQRVQRLAKSGAGQPSRAARANVGHAGVTELLRNFRDRSAILRCSNYPLT
jgi:hypothetical protein